MTNATEKLIARFDAASIRHGSAIQVYARKDGCIQRTGEPNSDEADRELESLCRDAVELLSELKIDLPPATNSHPELIHIFDPMRFTRWVFARSHLRPPDPFSKSAPRENGWMTTHDNFFRACARALEKVTPTIAPVPVSLAAPIVVDEDDIAILRTLSKFHPQLCDLYVIVEETHIARKSVGKRLNSLISRGLASRPEGERKGATITHDGLALIEKISSPK